MLKLESRPEGHCSLNWRNRRRNEEDTVHQTLWTAAHVNKCSNWFLLLVYWRSANQLGTYRHLLHWTVYMCKHARAQKDITNVKAQEKESRYATCLQLLQLRVTLPPCQAHPCTMESSDINWAIWPAFKLHCSAACSHILVQTRASIKCDSCTCPFLAASAPHPYRTWVQVRLKCKQSISACWVIFHLL